MATSTSTSPLPPGEDYIAATRQSCASASQATGLVPNLAAIDAFLRTLDQTTFERLRTQHGLNFPLRFPTPTAEVNFLGILALLNSFSGYRTAFHKATGAGAYQNVIRLIIGLYIAGAGDGAEDRLVGSPALTAKGMCALTEARVVELMGVSVHEEKQHESLPGVTVGVRRGEMFDVVQLILKTVQSVGKKLVELKVGSLGAYLVHLMKQAQEKDMDDLTATDFMVKQLATAFPEFRDSHTLPLTPAGQPVFVFKRIFFLLHSLHLRFSAGHPEWRIPNTYKTLPMFVDNVLPTLCVWFNLLSSPTGEGMKTLNEWVSKANCNADLPRESLANLPKDAPGPTLSVDETYAIRAATLNLGRAVCERAHELAKQEPERSWFAELNEVDLDGYLWAVAKDDQGLRKVPRFVFPSIHF